MGRARRQRSGRSGSVLAVGPGGPVDAAAHADAGDDADDGDDDDDAGDHGLPHSLVESPVKPFNGDRQAACGYADPHGQSGVRSGAFGGYDHIEFRSRARRRRQSSSHCSTKFARASSGGGLSRLRDDDRPAGLDIS